MSGHEEWRPFLEGFYEVSNIGRVRRAKPGVNTSVGRLKVTRARSENGYCLFGAFVEGRRFEILVHRAVAEAFIGPCPDGYQVNHIDGDKLNNRVENLEYVTAAENMAHAKRLGLLATGDRNYARKHPELLHRGDDHWTRKHPEWCPRGDQNGSRTKPERLQRGEDRPNSKLTESDVIELRRRHSAGESVLSMHKSFGISYRNALLIIRRKAWSHVP